MKAIPAILAATHKPIKAIRSLLFWFITETFQSFTPHKRSVAYFEGNVKCFKYLIVSNEIEFLILNYLTRMRKLTVNSGFGDPCAMLPFGLMQTWVISGS